MRDTDSAIDEIVGTAFNTVVNYGVKPDLLKTQTLKRIKKELSTLDAKTRKTVEGDYQGRLERFFEFVELPTGEQQRIAKQARLKHETIEKVYSSDSARN